MSSVNRFASCYGIRIFVNRVWTCRILGNRNGNLVWFYFSVGRNCINIKRICVFVSRFLCYFCGMSFIWKVSWIETIINYPSKFLIRSVFRLNRCRKLSAQTCVLSTCFNRYIFICFIANGNVCCFINTACNAESAVNADCNIFNRNAVCHFKCCCFWGDFIKFAVWNVVTRLRLKNYCWFTAGHYGVMTCFVNLTSAVGSRSVIGSPRICCLTVFVLTCYHTPSNIEVIAFCNTLRKYLICKVCFLTCFKIVFARDFNIW